ncbi:MAG: hypothetical protein AAGA76_09470 [Pseudomonadota bacterium]
MATQTQNSFADTVAARLIALCIALLLAIVLVYNYKDDFGTVFSDSSEAGLPVTNTETTPEEAANPALAQCLQQRIGDVDRMKEEGILSEAQYASFRARAKELCIQQNSG